MNRGNGGGKSPTFAPSFPAQRAGQLRRKLTIQQKSSAAGLASAGGSWVNVLSTWGSVTARQATAMLQLAAGQQMPKTVYDIIIRYPPSVSILPGMRVVDGSRTFTISNANDTDERHRILHLACMQEPAT